MRRGEIYFVDLSPVRGREQGGRRPVLVFSSDAINSSSLIFVGTVLVASDDSSTIFIGLEGQASVLALSQQQSLLPGEEITVPHPSGNVSTPRGSPK